MKRYSMLRNDQITCRPWPDVMDSTIAAEYCAVTVQSIGKAVREGKLASCGRRGGSGARTFEKTELERYLRGSGA